MGTQEQLILDLNNFDCTTFVEQVLALARAFRQAEPDYGHWAREVEGLRYRTGRCTGYADRIHYFSEWLETGANTGKLQYPIPNLPLEGRVKSLDFMGTHRSAYPRLGADSTYGSILEIERQLADRSFAVLPIARINEVQPLLRTGDIVAFFTSISGLDVTHTGFVYMKEGRAHLLHASTQGSVRISSLTLADYAARLKRCTGLLLARPL